MKPEDVVAAVVVDDEHVNANETALAFLYPERPGLLLKIGREPEHRSFFQFALNADLAVHHPDQLAGDGQSQTSAAVFPGRRAILLAECLKEILLRFRADSDAGVFHLEAKDHSGGRLGLLRDTQDHLS